MEEHFWVYVTAPSHSEAKYIAKTCIEEKLAACVNLLGQIESFYWWEEQVEESSESAFLFKTHHSKLNSLKERITELHSYEVPCILAIPLSNNSAASYLEWITRSVKGDIS